MLVDCRLHSAIQALEGLGGAHVAGYPFLHLDFRRDTSHLPSHEGQHPIAKLFSCGQAATVRPMAQAYIPELLDRQL